MKKTLCMLVAFGLVGSAAMAVDLNVAVQTPTGDPIASVEGGEAVDYQVVGVLSDTNNLGLALFGFDLAFDGGDLAQADEPGVAPLNNFARNLGITNPAGFGGTIINGDLVQVGGGQNTINNIPSNADFPVGSVITNLGHSEIVLATGSLTAPLENGTYTLGVANLFGNVITSEEASYWAVEAFNPGSVESLSIQVGPQDTASVVSTTPTCDESLVRAANNCILITLSESIADSLPGAGDLLIQPLQAGGAYGADLSADFTYAAEGAGEILRIDEDGDVLQNETWYAVRNVGGWSRAAAFEVHFRVVYGDVDNDGLTGGLDAGEIWGFRGPASGDCDKYDLDVDGTIGGLDAGEAWGNRGSTAPDASKPDGHVCP
ncbi:MAG: hypothetical protein PVI86_09755 [Phycisphaerae bacterium]|jgi:hypothetical protein